MQGLPFWELLVILYAVCLFEPFPNMQTTTAQHNFQRRNENLSEMNRACPKRNGNSQKSALRKETIRKISQKRNSQRLKWQVTSQEGMRNSLWEKKLKSLLGKLVEHDKCKTLTWSLQSNRLKNHWNFSCQISLEVLALKPCSSGSPLNNFRMDPSVLSASQQEWPELISSVSRYLNLGHDASFELPAHNANWSKPETQAVLSECRLHFQGIVKLCRFGVVSRAQIPVGKELRFQTFSQSFAAYLNKFSTCEHVEHAQLSGVSYTATGFYNKKLARALIDAIRYARKQNLSLVQRCES